MKRRHFLKVASVGALGLVGDPPLAMTAAQSRAPDILMIMPDQMRGDCLSVVGHPAVQTPAFDRLARDGALFRRAYATAPSCISARHALLTGLYPQTSGVVGYAPKPIRTAPLPQLLAAAGYQTILVGRHMHQHAESGRCGYQIQTLGSTYVDNDEYDTYLRTQVPDTGGIRHYVLETLGLSFNHWQARPWPLADHLHPTEWAAARCLESITRTAPDRPLFLTASFYAPHSPLFPPERLFTKYRNAELPDPARGSWVGWESLSPDGDAYGQRVLLTGDALRDAQAGYFGLIDHLDEQVSLIIDAFKARSHRAGRPWLIILLSDHGEMLGDHGYYRKAEPYEGSTHIPFVVAGSPELGYQRGHTVDEEPVCLEDVMPTVLALARVEIPAYVDGIDLAPLLAGDRQLERDWLHLEHAPSYTDNGFHALTDGLVKYIWRPSNGKEQYFDLHHDPRETVDLAQHAAHQGDIAQWRQRLIGALAHRPEGFSTEGRLVSGQPYPPVTAGTLPADESSLY